MDKSTTLPNENNPKASPKPIQANKIQDNNPNVQKKPEAKNAAPQSLDKKNVDDMDSNNTQKVKGQNNGNTNGGAISEEQWKAKVGSAKQQWSKLQQDELVDCCGDSDQLSSLVQKRYSVNKAEADKQVKEFFSKH